MGLKSGIQEWIDQVGKSLPDVIRLSQRKAVYGSEALSQWYGISDPRVGLWKKLKMAWKNG